MEEQEINQIVLFRSNNRLYSLPLSQIVQMKNMSIDAISKLPNELKLFLGLYRYDGVIYSIVNAIPFAIKEKNDIIFLKVDKGDFAFFVDEIIEINSTYDEEIIQLDGNELYDLIASGKQVGE